MDDTTSRTHEPSFRELVVQLDALERLVCKNDNALRDLLLERDRRYEDRFRAQETGVDTRFRAAETAVTAALAAQKELTNNAFRDSEKAIVKAEVAQSDYNVRSNEFRGQLDDQAKMLMPRAETQQRFAQQDKIIEELKNGIADLRESRSEGGGREIQSKYLTGVGLVIAGLIISAAVFFSRLIK